MSEPPEPEGTGAPPAGRGAHLVDADGTRHLDFVLGGGAAILGHDPAEVAAALHALPEGGVSPEDAAGLRHGLGRRIRRAFPGADVVEFFDGETGALEAAAGIARAVTGRPLIVGVAGAHHLRGIAAELDLGVPYNSVEAAAEIFARRGGEIAAVAVEPVATATGCIAPAPGYLQSLRRITREHGALLIFDELVTGFRVADGGAQGLLGVTADLTCLGGVIGGGLPLGACAGSRDLMRRGSGSGGVGGDPRALTAGIAVLDRLAEGSVYARLEALGSRLDDGLRTASVAASFPCAVNRVGGMLTVFPGVERVDDADGARHADLDHFARLRRAWSHAGILWPASPFEPAFLSTAHQVADVDRAVSAFAGALRTRAETSE